MTGTSVAEKVHHSVQKEQIWLVEYDQQKQNKITENT